MGIFSSVPKYLRLHAHIILNTESYLRLIQDVFTVYASLYDRYLTSLFIFAVSLACIFKGKVIIPTDHYSDPLETNRIPNLTLT